MVQFVCDRCGRSYDNLEDAQECEAEHNRHVNPEVKPGDVIAHEAVGCKYIVMYVFTDVDGIKSLSLLHLDDNNKVFYLPDVSVDNFKYSVVDDPNVKREVFELYDTFKLRMDDVFHTPDFFRAYINNLED